MFHKNQKRNRLKKPHIPFKYKFKWHNQPPPDGLVKCCYCGSFLDIKNPKLLGTGLDGAGIYEKIATGIINGETVYACDKKDFERIKEILEKQKSGYYG